MSSYREGVVLEACLDLGLDLETGVSTDIINVKALEEATNMRLTSNGSKVIRRDSEVFSKFNIDYYYGVRGQVIGYVFKGYKSKGDQIKCKGARIASLYEKIENLYNLIDSEETSYECLVYEGKDFSAEDVISTL